MSSLSQKLKSLPSSPGVYIFKDAGGAVLYVGKAGSLKDRVNSYFQLKGEYARPIEYAIEQIADLETRNTDTVMEAYILEQELIKKLQPKYNAMGKDDKSFSYIFVTKEEFPRFLVLRATDIEYVKRETRNVKLETKHAPRSTLHASRIYGPYTSKRNIEIVLKILRRIFPYHNKPQKTEKGCLDYQIGLCPGPYAGVISKSDYAKNIRAIRMILEGKKNSLLGKMKKEMQEYSEKDEFETAAAVRNQIFALQHIQDVALLSNGNGFKSALSTYLNKNQGKSCPFRIEGYDISNISGKYSVGSMVVFDDCEGELRPNKSQYRRFKIKTVDGANDVGSMEEVLRRRFGNNWPRPNLILLDGGAGHINMARKVLHAFRIEIPLLAVAKGPTRKKLDFRTFGTVPEIPERIIEQLRDEAHRFAITYHRKVRGRAMKKSNDK